MTLQSCRTRRRSTTSTKAGTLRSHRDVDSVQAHDIPTEKFKHNKSKSQSLGMEANQQSLRAQQTRADRGSIHEWVHHTNDIIRSQQSCLTWMWLQDLWDNTSFPQNSEGIFQPSSVAVLPCLRQQVLGRIQLHPCTMIQSLGTFPAPLQHWSDPLEAHKPPRIATHECKIAGWRKAVLQPTL